AAQRAEAATSSNCTSRTAIWRTSCGPSSTKGPAATSDSARQLRLPHPVRFLEVRRDPQEEILSDQVGLVGLVDAHPQSTDQLVQPVGDGLDHLAVVAPARRNRR